MSDILEWLDTNRARPRDALARAFGEWLLRSDRPLASGWWHAGDVDEAFAWATERLTALGVEPVPRTTFEAWQRAIDRHTDDEEERRRHQLGHVATYANARLAGGRRFHCLGDKVSWERDEPAWVLLDDREHEALCPLAGPPPDLEAAYSGRDREPEALPKPSLDPSRVPPHVAAELAEAAFRRGAFEEALRFIRRVSDAGDHGLRVRLRTIDLLHKTGRDDEARALWGATADEWLSGARRVWDTQWQTLSELRAQVGVPADDPRSRRIEAQLGSDVVAPPQPTVCPACGGKGWIHRDPTAFPERCACK